MLTANQEWFKVWRTIDGEGGDLGLVVCAPHDSS